MLAATKGNFFKDLMKTLPSATPQKGQPNRQQKMGESDQNPQQTRQAEKMYEKYVNSRLKKVKMRTYRFMDCVLPIPL